MTETEKFLIEFERAHGRPITPAEYAAELEFRRIIINSYEEQK